MKSLFPSPLEVDRFISIYSYSIIAEDLFPSPLEVDSFLSTTAYQDDFSIPHEFPSPPEVDRFISLRPCRDE